MQEEIENGCHQLETLLVDSADKTFDKFEIYTLRNILTVEEGLSPWMRLGHYEVRSFGSLTRSAASRPLRASRSMDLRREKIRYRYLELIPSTESPTAAAAQRPNPGINPPPPAQAPRNSKTQLRPPPPTHVKCRSHHPAPNPRLAFKRPLSLKSLILDLSPLRRSS
jgi:hypothetical protein